MITDQRSPNGDPLATKLSRIASFSAKAEINDWASVDAKLDAALLHRIEVEARRVAAKREVEERADYVLVDGRNDAERKAAKIKALLDDDGYQALLRQLREAERDVAVIDVEIDSLGRQSKRLRSVVAYKTAVIEFLGSE